MKYIKEHFLKYEPKGLEFRLSPQGKMENPIRKNYMIALVPLDDNRYVLHTARPVWGWQNRGVKKPRKVVTSKIMEKFEWNIIKKEWEPFKHKDASI